MCLVTNRVEPNIAPRDIKVYKHVGAITGNTAITPFQGFKFTLNEELIAEPSETHLRPTEDETWEISSGVIHACLWPDLEMGMCLEAYIPKGTMYWCGIDKTTICAKRLFVTDKVITPEDCAGMDTEMASAAYSEAPKNSDGVTVGDFLVSNDFVSPTTAANCAKDAIQGIVVGFNDNEPVVANIQNLKWGCIDHREYSRLHKHIPNLEEAQKDMDGYEHTTVWKKTCKDDPKRYEAYHAVTKLSDNHYVPALGEMELLWKNITHIAAGCSLAHIACPFAADEYFLTSTEATMSTVWGSNLNNRGINRYWEFKYCHNKIVPFIAPNKLS